MSAKITFLPWVRVGAGALHPVAAGTHARIDAQLRFETDAGERTAGADLALLGPGEVESIDTREIIRRYPAPGVTDVEPTFLALVEFRSPDFAWRFTPGPADGDRLRPWLMLVIAKTSEVSLDTRAPGRALGSAVFDAEALPDLETSWACAHAQVTGDGDDPDLGATSLCRLLCPRPLEPSSEYQAFLVPAFERGRLAGMGEDPGDVAALEPAWTSGVSAHLPFYDSFTFSTGLAGSFEELARRLRPTDAGPGLAPEQMDVSELGLSLPPASTTPLQFEVALVDPDAEKVPWATEQRVPFQTALSDRLETASAVQLAPPLYGRTYVANQPTWMNDVNLDPRLRAAAGLGAEVVRREQEALMAAAWDQYDGVVEANQEIAAAGMAELISVLIHRGVFGTLSAGSALLLAGALTGQVRGSPRTIRAILADSKVPRGLMSPAFRRAARRSRVSGSRIVERAAKGELSRQAPPPRENLGTIERVESYLARPAKQQWLWLWLLLLLLAFVLLPFSFLASALVALSALFWWWRTTRPSSSFVPSRTNPQTGQRESLSTDDPVELEGARAEFAAAFSAMTDLRKPGRPRTPQTQVDPGLLSRKLIDGIEPRQSIRKSLAERMRRTVVAPPPDRPPQKIAAGPVIEYPMYEPLARLSHGWLIANLDAVQANSVTALRSNRRFIEAYMLGLNHEMGRELRYRGFPTDRRATYFSHFWDHRAAVTPSPDIAPIHTWAGALGDNGESSEKAPIVLVLRGDLLRRFPNAVVYAARAEAGPTGARFPTNEEHAPVFEGFIEPDVNLFGFELTAGELRGSSVDPGWFVVLAERPSAPRFEHTPIVDSDTAAIFASKTVQLGFRIAIHGSDLLEPTEES